MVNDGMVRCHVVSQTTQTGLDVPAYYLYMRACVYTMTIDVDVDATKEKRKGKKISLISSFLFIQISRRAVPQEPRLHLPASQTHGGHHLGVTRHEIDRLVSPLDLVFALDVKYDAFDGPARGELDRFDRTDRRWCDRETEAGGVWECDELVWFGPRSCAHTHTHRAHTIIGEGGRGGKREGRERCYSVRESGD